MQYGEEVNMKKRRGRNTASGGHKSAPNVVQSTDAPANRVGIESEGRTDYWGQMFELE
jgi:hypothetical protein